tara:strand:- start:2376 stop:2843 length:468 start_codon:yes stop_codon:yes gene_type:complete
MLGLGAALALGGMNLLGSMYAGNKAANASAASANAANFRANQNIYHGRDMAKMNAAMTMWGANQNDRFARENLNRQKDASVWEQQVLAPLMARSKIDQAERFNIFENSPDNTALRKKKKREDFAGRMLEANSKLSGLFGPSLQDKQYQAELGFFG